MQHNFMAKGMASDVALKSSYQLLDFSMMKQAAVLSYMDVFMGIGIMFLLCIPFVLMVKAKKAPKIDMGDMH
jgi:DHA2 family multidrug resistance protein